MTCCNITVVYVWTSVLLFMLHLGCVQIMWIVALSLKINQMCLCCLLQLLANYLSIMLYVLAAVKIYIWLHVRNLSCCMAKQPCMCVCVCVCVYVWNIMAVSDVCDVLCVNILHQQLYLMFYKTWFSVLFKYCVMFMRALIVLRSLMLLVVQIFDRFRCSVIVL